MKTINHKLKLLLYVMLIGLACSCKKEQGSPKPEPTPFSAVVEGGLTTVPAAGAKLNIVISAGTDGWWITSPQPDWLSITRMYGSGDFKLPVTIKANTSGQARTVSINVNPTFNLPPVVFKINQDK
ncbi:BACON domain-containing protein [Pedobacter sp. N36a]|uniref:BACON domain-containing protein n=1 Tax=Pedobacter sp. N36a TaxID=2767996 RepID=UPI0016575B9B|nr:BACON domain-containing protein [Pedobacter sp. N36a]MBC8987971.1 BACON domain-containing protein [Pedobacter sp. N36a]